MRETGREGVGEGGGAASGWAVVGDAHVPYTRYAHMYAQHRNPTSCDGFITITPPATKEKNRVCWGNTALSHSSGGLLLGDWLAGRCKGCVWGWERLPTHVRGETVVPHARHRCAARVSPGGRHRAGLTANERRASPCPAPPPSRRVPITPHRAPHTNTATPGHSAAGHQHSPPFPTLKHTRHPPCSRRDAIAILLPSHPHATASPRRPPDTQARAKPKSRARPSVASLSLSTAVWVVAPSFPCTLFLSHGSTP